MLDGYFRKTEQPQARISAVIAFQGADTMAEATIMGGGAYAARGMAYLAVDFSGQVRAFSAARLPGRRIDCRYAMPRAA